MEIDAHIEPLVRETLAAAVKRDEERFERALAAFSSDDVAAKGVQLATAVALYVLQDQYGGRPSTAELQAIANKIAELESWAEVSAADIVTLLNAATDGTRLDQVLPLERAVILPFVVAAYLLASCCKEGEWWFDYLDQAEAAVESS